MAQALVKTDAVSIDRGRYLTNTNIELLTKRIMVVTGAADIWKDRDQGSPDATIVVDSRHLPFGILVLSLRRPALINGVEEAGEALPFPTSG